MLRSRLTLFAIASLFVLGCQSEAPEPEETAPEMSAAESSDPLTDPQTLSLFGEELFAQEDTTGAVAAADSALAEAPDDLDRIIEAGRVRRTVWQYRQAMEFYTRAIELAPNDWRAYRFRGHRHISLRDFDAAVVDLERARQLAPYNFDVAYHLGLAYFLAGRFEEAADEYVRCLDLAEAPEAIEADSEAYRSCAQNADDADSRVAMTEWAVRALKRSDRGDEADVLLEGITEGMPVEDNIAYYYDLLYYKGIMTRDELLNPPPDAPYRLETVGFGVANDLIARGEAADAIPILEQLARDPWWPGFGRIAAEAELARRMN